jgi:hypothetical protein
VQQVVHFDFDVGGLVFINWEEGREALFCLDLMYVCLLAFFLFSIGYQFVSIDVFGIGSAIT